MTNGVAFVARRPSSQQKTSAPQIGTKDCFVVPPNFILDFRFWIFDRRSGNPKSKT
jgi:hypothetical protein